MNDGSKLMLSDEELQLLHNSEWILTKRRILEKVALMLGDLADKQLAVLQHAKDWLPSEVLTRSAKISRGENYLQLPFMILDHPRIFGTEDIFAIRTMFWWGNFFSVTLHLSGKFKQQYEARVLQNILQNKSDLYLCTHIDQWHHHFENDNYVRADELDAQRIEDIIRSGSFVKIARRFPMHAWNTLPVQLGNCFRDMIAMLEDQLPRR